MPSGRLLARVLAVAFAAAAVPAFAQRGAPDPEHVAELAMRLTNEFRAQEGGHAVAVNAKLLAAAS